MIAFVLLEIECIISHFQFFSSYSFFGVLGLSKIIMRLGHCETIGQILRALINS